MRRSVFILLFLILILYEAGNLTGFSWKRLEYVSQHEIINAAVRYSYPDIYSNLKELQVDYAKFKPEVRYWGSWSWQVDNGLLEKLFGLTRYQVRMPEEIVMVTVDGKADFSRGDSDCPGDGACAPIAPDNPEQGIVGTVQLGGPTYEVSEDFSAQWEGDDKGAAFISGHCFSSYINSPVNKNFVVSPKGAEPTTVRRGYGFYLVAITSDAYAAMRISKAEFLKSKSCSKEAREAWPNVGGWAWKR
jgi:hypothetical protein